MTDKKTPITSRIGLYVKMILTGGTMIMGVVKHWDVKSILILSMAGEFVEVFNPMANVIAVFYIQKKDGTLMTNKDVDTGNVCVEPTHSPGNLEEIGILAKLRSETDLNSVRTLLKSPVCSAKEVEYEELSTVSRIKNHTTR